MRHKWYLNLLPTGKLDTTPTAFHIEIYLLPPPLAYEFTWCPPSGFSPRPPPDNYCIVPNTIIEGG